MTTDALKIVDQHRDQPVHQVGRILVEQGHCGTDYQRPAMCIAAYWQHQRARIESGEIERGCDGPCQPWTNSRGIVMCSHSGLICAGHCEAASDIRHGPKIGATRISSFALFPLASEHAEETWYDSTSGKNYRSDGRNWVHVDRK